MSFIPLRNGKIKNKPKRQTVTPKSTKRISRPKRSKPTLEDSLVSAEENSATESSPRVSLPLIQCSPRNVDSVVQRKLDASGTEGDIPMSDSSKRVILKLRSFQMKDDFQGPVVPNPCEVDPMLPRVQNHAISPNTTKRLLRKLSSRSMGDMRDIFEEDGKQISTETPQSRMMSFSSNSTIADESEPISSGVVSKSRKLLRKLSSFSASRLGLEKESDDADEATREKKSKSQAKQMRLLGITDFSDTTAAPSGESLLLIQQHNILFHSANLHLSCAETYTSLRHSTHNIICICLLLFDS
jgi:hypothetical protein